MIYYRAGKQMEQTKYDRKTNKEKRSQYTRLNIKDLEMDAYLKVRVYLS